MSYAFSGVNQHLAGSFTSTYASTPLTLACFIKITVHPAANRSPFYFGNSSASIDDSQALQTDTTVDSFGCYSRTTTSVAGLASQNIDNTWAAFVGVFTTSSLRDIYIKTASTTGQNTATRAVANVMQFLSLGENFAGAADYTGKIAEAAIWNIALGTSDIDTYMRQTRRASSIAASSLIGYWPLSVSGALNNLGTDAGGTLTATGATFDNDHPGLGTSYQLMGQAAA